jgi:DNA-binding SARP family transcriptional activator/Flp pilus assembly protein TadD
MAQHGPAEVRVLGTIEVTGPAGTAELAGVRARTVLALLALGAGTALATTRLVDAVWGEQPPRTAVRTLHSHLARLRQSLAECGLPGVLVTRGPGYLLAVPPEQVDALRFEAALARGRACAIAGETDRAVAELQAGLALWRGEPLADARVEGWAAAELERLRELRLAGYEEMWQARLARGEWQATIDEVDRLLVRYPTRERLVGLLMRALHRSGRSADALDRYERLRLRLADELGADPGRPLRELHTAILRGEDPASDSAPPVTEPEPAPAAPARSRPAQLPPTAGHFTGRQDALAALDRLVSGEGTAAESWLGLVCGPAGIGKTTLVVQWAHRVRERFPDGQLFLDLRGHDPDAALAPAEVLAHALRGLGVPADRLPAATAEQLGLYRSLVHDRRVLLVLDNAGTADHVLPLVPAGPTSVLVTTSRRRLAALAVHHPVRRVELNVLDEAESRQLLGRIIGPDRPAREPAATAELVLLCGHTPLALRIAAARLAARPRQPIADLVAELAGDHRLDALRIEGDSHTVRAVFASSYETLTEPAARMFRRLGLHPGASFTAGLAAALDGVTAGQARRAVDELAASHLVADLDAGRFRLHDLIAVYARERLQADEPAGESAAATDRLVDWYLTVADAANRLLDPARDRVVVSPEHPVGELPFRPDPAAALAFLDGEQDNLRSVVGHAAASGRLLAACQLSYLVAGYFDSRGHTQQRIEIYRTGLAAAQRLGDPGIEGLMRSGLGVACIAARDYRLALVELRRALDLMRAAGDQRGEGHVHNNIAVALGELGRFREAIAAGEQALAVHTATGHSYGTIIALNNQGYSYARSGRFPAAVGCLARALALARRDRVVRWEAWILNTLGEIHRDQDQPDRAMAYFTQALGLRRRTGDRRNEALTLAAIGATQLRAAGASGEPGALARARDSLQAAYTLGRELDDPHLQAVALAGLGRTRLAGGDLPAARELLDRARAMRALVPDPAEEAGIAGSLQELAARSGADVSGRSRTPPPRPAPPAVRPRSGPAPSRR